MPSKEKNMDKETTEKFDLLMLQLRRARYNEGSVMRALSERFGLSWKEVQKRMKKTPFKRKG